MFENKRLIKLTNSNDEIDQVIQKNYMSIYKYCYYHVGNSNAAQDITQEVFLKFLKHIDRYKEYGLSLIHISEPTRPLSTSRMPSSA